MCVCVFRPSFIFFKNTLSEEIRAVLRRCVRAPSPSRPASPISFRLGLVQNRSILNYGGFVDATISCSGGHLPDSGSIQSTAAAGPAGPPPQAPQGRTHTTGRQYYFLFFLIISNPNTPIIITQKNSQYYQGAFYWCESRAPPPQAPQAHHHRPRRVARTRRAVNITASSSS